jgi:Flp pilus assembly protein TadB
MNRPRVCGGAGLAPAAGLIRSLSAFSAFSRGALVFAFLLAIGFAISLFKVGPALLAARSVRYWRWRRTPAAESERVEVMA